MIPGVIKYMDISSVSLTAPTTVGTDTTSSALSITTTQFSKLLTAPGIIVVRYKVGSTVKRAVASVVEGGSGHIDIVEDGTLNIIKYSIKVVSSAVKVVGSIVKAAAAT